MDTTWHWQPKKVWEVYNDFCDLLQELQYWYKSSTFVDPDGLTIFKIEIFEIVHTSRGAYGFEIACRNIAIRAGEMEANIKQGYQSCIDMLYRIKK